MLTREPYLPTKATLAALIRKYDVGDDYTRDDIRWMVNVLHALNDDPEYQRHQDELDEPDAVDVVEAPSINIAPKEESSEQTETP